MNAELKSANEARLSRKRPRLIDVPDRQLPFGSFSGETIYRNRLHRNESLQDGHVSLSNLVLPGCTSALCITFVGPDPLWLERMFDSVDNLLVVRHDARPRGRIVGDAELSPIPTSNEKQRQGWFWLTAKPHTGGYLHAKLLLFRSKEGLRVAVVGSNLIQGQWEGDRDTLWVQDFGATPHPYDYKQFGRRLRSFLNDLMQCRDFDHQILAQSMIKAMFDKIEFVTASVRLVVSFPRPSTSDANCGGWRQLANSVDQLLREIDNGSDHGSDEGSEENSNELGPKAVHAMAGSFGDLQPDFLLQMLQAMHGKNESAPKDTAWDEIDGIRCLWPSRDTARSMNPDALANNMRAMAERHWDTIPEKARERIFFDAIPNPKETELEFYPISHAKVLYAGGRRGIIYVGSHNFSKAAWGLRNGIPKNVEIGIVLGSASCTVRQQWRERLPYLLPADSDLSPTSYVPASAHTGIRDAYQQGKVDEARKMLRDHLTSNDGSTSIVSSEVIDLCDSD